MSFKIFSDQLQDILIGMGFEEPTEIQKLSFPPIQAGKDCLLMAPTGHGKTEAAMLPIIDRLMEIPKAQRDKMGIIVLYITPLKALNRDIYRRIIEIGEQVGVEIALRHGDTSSYERSKQTKNPPDILITTPEMFQAILVAKILGKVHLKTVRAVIVDEIHSLVDSKRGTQLSLALQRLKKRVGEAHLQFIGLSATVGTPQKVANFLVPERDVQIVNAMSEKKIEIEVVYPQLQKKPYFKRLQRIIAGSDEVTARFDQIISLLSRDKSTLLFTNTRQMGEVLSWRFTQFLQENVQEILGFDIQHKLHHSSIGKEERISAESEFRHGTINLVIATSSLELGIDIGHIDQVIQYMSPRRSETLLQRVGRSGHTREEVSKGTILSISPRDSLEAATIAHLALQGKIEASHIYPQAVDVLLHQVAGILLESRDQSEQDIYEVVKGAYPYLQLTKEQFKAVLEFGVDTYLFVIDEESDQENPIYIPRRKCYQYYYSNLSTIPDVRTYKVINIANNRVIGVLDESFVLNLEVSLKIVLKGESFKILSIDEDELLVRVSPQMDFEAAIPTWKGELIPISPLVAQNFKSLYYKGIPDDIPTDIHTKATIQRFIEDQPDNLRPQPNVLLIENAGKTGAIHSFLGSKGNEALAILLSGLITARSPMGGGVTYNADAYTILFKVGLQSVSLIKETLEMLEPEHVQPLLARFLKKTDLFASHFQNVAKRMSLIKKDAQVTRKTVNILKSKYTDSIVGDEALNEIFFEKIDYKAVENLIRQIQSNEVKIELVSVGTVESPLALAGQESGGEHILKSEPTAAILAAVERRLYRRTLSMHCMNLKCDWTAVKRVERMSEDIVCPKCGRRYIAILHPKAGNIRGLLRKELQGNLNLDDKKKLNNAKKSADLVLNYGRKAAIILAARGVGPTKAARIIRDAYSTRESLLEEVLHQESIFARTREFWD